MPSFFAKMQHPMPPIPDDKRIVTKEFVAASTDLIPLIDILGTFFKPIKSDVNGNITSLETVYQKNPEKFSTLRDMLEDEKVNGDVQSNKSAAVAVLWLKRSFEFLSSFLRKIAEDESKKESIAEFIQSAYVETLKKYHGWIARQLVMALAHGVPYRTDFLKKLGVSNETTEEEVLKDMLDYCNVVGEYMTTIHELLVELDLNSEAKA